MEMTEYCRECGMRDDDWFLCKKGDCPKNAKSVTERASIRVGLQAAVAVIKSIHLQSHTAGPEYRRGFERMRQLSVMALTESTNEARQTSANEEAKNAILRELGDRRLLNDVDDDLHDEIAVALLRIARSGMRGV